jgi:uncharacterized protein (DUF1697 family)
VREQTTTYIAFLRAINVAGHAVVKMTDLKDTFAAAGCCNVRTYIQSGNVVFDCPSGTPAATFNKVRKKLRELIGGDPCVIFRTVEDVQAIVKSAPFKAFDAEPLVKFYVVFLAEKPLKKPRLPLISEKEAVEAIAVKNLEAFIVSRRKPNGFYGFPNNFTEKELGVMATSRNWSTVTKIVEFARKL